MDLMNSEQVLFEEISAIIEQGRREISMRASRETVLIFWQVGRRINDEVLDNQRADYGKQIVSRLATQLTAKYGRSFEQRNLRRMMQFAEQFLDFEIVSPPATQLSWSHFVEILPLKTQEAKMFYLNEAAILRELEKFILEFGKGFAFVERQKRMIIDGVDFHLDLLFYNRYLKRLVAVELKQGLFKAEYNGQMKLYLRWLNRYERQEGESEPIGLILCTGGNREQIELLEMDRDGILVAEYWTILPPKAEFEQKIQMILAETRERLARKKLLPLGR
ncbi:MAG: PDDEXK nuclease domain-containing protein [Clostridiales bacterium]|nr:PDDEXK nuclease domain-containing protein [Clostridiales bacterium]